MSTPFLRSFENAAKTVVYISKPKATEHALFSAEAELTDRSACQWSERRNFVLRRTDRRPATAGDFRSGKFILGGTFK